MSRRKKRRRALVEQELQPILEEIDEKARRWEPYLKTRYCEAVITYRDRHEGYRLTFMIVRGIQAVGSLSIPVLAARNTSAHSDTLAWSILVVSLIVAVATGVEQVVRPGMRWRLARDAYADLVALGWNLVRNIRRAENATSSGADSGAAKGKTPTADAEALLQKFSNGVEGVIGEYETNYLNSVAPTSGPAAPGGSPASAIPDSAESGGGP
jgi:hypothetical protein